METSSTNQLLEIISSGSAPTEEGELSELSRIALGGTTVLDQQRKDKLVESLSAFLLAQGFTCEYISKVLCLPRDLIFEISKRPNVVRQMLVIQGSMQENVPSRIERALPLLFERQLMIALTTQDERLAAKVQQDLLDRGLGRAVQRHQTSLSITKVDEESEKIDSSINALMTRISALESMRQRSA